MKTLFAFLLLMPALAFGVGTVTVTRTPLYKSLDAGSVRVGETVSVAWTADAAAATVPNTTMVMRGFLVKAVTNPGSTAPTDNYDITLGDPSDSALDTLAGSLANRDTTNTEQALPVVSGAVVPVYLNGTYTFGLSGNAVNSATGTVVFYLLDGV